MPSVRLSPLRLHSPSAQSSTPRREEPTRLSARTINGLTPPAKALAVAATRIAPRDAVVLYVVPADPDLDTAAGDVRFFLGALEGLSDAAAERAVLPFPSHQVDPYRGLAPHFRVTSARARALHAAALGDGSRHRRLGAGAAAATARAGIALSRRRSTLRPGVEIDPHALADILVEGGYERQDPVDEHGEFSLRGGILDVYPAGETSPIRIEFIGDTVDRSGASIPARSDRSRPSISSRSCPVRESAPESAQDRRASGAAHSRQLFDYLRASRPMRVVVSEPRDVRASVEKWWEQVGARP